MSATATPAARGAAGSAGASVAISAEGLAKAFQLRGARYHTLKERILHPLARAETSRLRALHDVSFDVARGEFFGVVGRNGSGKSTLLKCLAGIYRIDAGRITVTGRLSPFIELGVGFNPELTARDNVVINGIMLGLTPREARRRFDEIIEFAELGDFLDLKLKNYSSGMTVRLGFAVAIKVDAEILLVDEVLAVGDAAFQQKCFDAFHRLKRDGRTIIFVTHDMGAVERFCDRAMLLERGAMAGIGDPVRVGHQYIELNFGREAAGNDAGEVPGRFGDRGAAELVACWFEDDEHGPAETLEHGSWHRAAFQVEFHESVVDPVFEVTITDEYDRRVFRTQSDVQGVRGSYGPGDVAVCRLRFQNLLAPGRYRITPAISRAGGTNPLDVYEDMTTIVAVGPHRSGGIVDLPSQFEVGPR